MDAYDSPLRNRLFSMVRGGAPGETWFWCDRWTVALPVPTVGDQLTIRDQLWEIVEVDPDEHRGELAFRLIREELGLTFAELSPIAAVSIYVWSDAAQRH